MITTSKNKIIITDEPFFDVAATLTCGQVFRYIENVDGSFIVKSQNKAAKISTQGSTIEIVTDDTDYFVNYFDLNTDYSSAYQRLSSHSPFLEEVCEYGKGIRILRQNPTETLFSFIISANNNIKRIQHIIENICEKLGTPTEQGYAFPTVKQLAAADVDVFTKAGAGYRAQYIVDTARALVDTDVNQLAALPTPELKQKLLSLKGIGPKVADCILLFGFARADVCPVDTWIKKVYHNHFECGLPDGKISQYFVDTFREDTGLCQQYLFYFERKYRQEQQNKVK
jgi:N-glycosylase/DNA lyase